jgi:hypothetical protein
MSTFMDVLVDEDDAAVLARPDREAVATIDGLDPVLGIEPLLDAIPGVPPGAKVRELDHDLDDGTSLWALPTEVAVGLDAADSSSLTTIAHEWSNGTGMEMGPLLGVLEEIVDALRSHGPGGRLYLRLVV